MTSSVHALKKRDIESILPLTPTQQAVLIHSMSEDEDRGFVQVEATIAGDLDPTVLQRAWKWVVQRHPALRMSVHAPDRQSPRLIVWRRVGLPWSTEDWRGTSPDEQQARRLERWCALDRRRGLDLARPPVWRLRLTRLDEKSYHLLWSCHHLLLDGWSTGVVLSDLATGYRAMVDERTPAASSPVDHRDYLAWHREQDREAAQTFWRQQLGGAGPRTPLPFDRAEVADRAPLATASTQLASAWTRVLKDFVATHGATPSSVVLGAWALLLAFHAGTSEVVQFPWPLYRAVWLAQLLPDALYDALAARVKRDKKEAPDPLELS